jgi:hypothetical protein
LGDFIIKKTVIFILTVGILAGMLSACAAFMPQSSTEPSAVSTAPSLTSQTPSPIKTNAPASAALPTVSASPALNGEANPYGSVNGNIYTNTAAGFEIRLPEGYQVVNAEDT